MSGSTTEHDLASKSSLTDICYVSYGGNKESQYLPAIRQLISNDLSEPYSIYVYRYFLHQWRDLCFMALNPEKYLLGVIICKLEPHRGGPMRGYIAMLATRKEFRGRGIATQLVRMAVDEMIKRDADEIVLETEVDNIPSLRIYENLGFLRTKRLHRYYLNGNTAFRLALYLKPGIPTRQLHSMNSQPAHVDERTGQGSAHALEPHHGEDAQLPARGSPANEGGKS
ncbi:acyl-CoA N-acyltransferase, partial [Piedraia hortae CBS 480.64]